MHGGRRKGAGRPKGSGRYDEKTKLVRIPESLVPKIDQLLAEHVAGLPRRASTAPSSADSVGINGTTQNIVLLPPAEATDLMNAYQRNGDRFDVVHLDPVYEENSPRGRQRFVSKTLDLIYAASKITDHILCWGFPASLGSLVDRWPEDWRLEGWLTWHFQNAPSRALGWRPAQNACLHLASKHRVLHPKNYYSPSQQELADKGRLTFKPCPPNVVISPMISGFALRSESVGFRGGQKPTAVIEHVLKMCLPASGGTVLDPTCGSGTTGIVARKLDAKAVLSDRSAKALDIARARLFKAN